MLKEDVRIDMKVIARGFYTGTVVRISSATIHSIDGESVVAVKGDKYRDIRQYKISEVEEVKS